MKNMIVVFFAMLLCAATWAHEKKAEVVAIPKPAPQIVIDDRLVVTVHQAEKCAQIDLVISLDCDISKLVEKYKDLSPNNRRGYEKLMEYVADKLKTRGEELIRESLKKKPQEKPKEKPKEKT